METLNGKGFTEPLKAYIRGNRPFFGICLGMQTLFESSEEGEGWKGLGLIKGAVTKFDSSKTAVPHIGWNGLTLHKSHTFTDALEQGQDTAYFVHSYRATPTPENEEWVLSTTTYGGGVGSKEQFISSIQKGNVTACQFHPEKSGQVGLKLLGSFLSSLQCGNSTSQAAASVPIPVPPDAVTRLVKRVVACLDVRSNDQGDLVVTKGDQYDVREVKDPSTPQTRGNVRNLGKPVELAGRYYEEGADEICFLNITSFRQGVIDDLPMLQVLESASERVFVPMTVGGGIRSYTDSTGQARTYSAVEVAARYFRAGADKISLGSDAVIAAEELLARGGEPTGSSSIEQISRVYGSQAVVVSIDPRRVYVDSPDAAPKHTVLRVGSHPTGDGGGSREEFKHAWYQCTIKGGREGRDIDAVSLAKCCERLGAGEILLNCVDMDGQKAGFDIELVQAVMGAVSIPVVASSGAGAPEHFSEVFKGTDVQAALAAGIFHRGEVSINEVKAHMLDAGVPARRSA
ncbi:unnamed protein product [Discosporangium mesarthrocarpum]